VRYGQMWWRECSWTLPRGVMMCKLAFQMAETGFKVDSWRRVGVC